MVLAGGGTRFAIYLGMYAAACEAGRRPDVLLATCGGAIAAAIIAALPDDTQRKAWVCSAPMYRFWRGLKSTRKASITRTLAAALRRGLSNQRAPLIPDLFNDHLFESPAQIPLPAITAGTELAVVTLGGRLLFHADEVLQTRAGRKLFEQTVFCNPRSASLLADMRSPFEADCWGPHALAAEVKINVDMPLAQAARLSATDFYYSPCHHHDGCDYIGGVVDLFPIEIAHRLSENIMMEYKSSFDQLFMIPAWRTILGLDGNQRLRHVHSQSADVWIDTSDISMAQVGQAVQKKLDWRSNRLILTAPDSLGRYVELIEQQWQYGYQRGLEGCQRDNPGSQHLMRKTNRHNRAQRCGS